MINIHVKFDNIFRNIDDFTGIFPEKQCDNDVKKQCASLHFVFNFAEINKWPTKML